MIPRSMDAQNRAQDLSASILSAATPPQIAAACSAVDSFLRKHASDQSRAFFSVAFPSLICRLFGFDSSAASSSASSWIDQAAFDPDLAAKLFNVLSPAGILISSIAAVDRHAIIKYVFPAERLPEWIRFVLQLDKYSSTLADLCPLFKSRVKDNQIQLNCFEYFMFWFAYYPVCKGNSENAESEAVRRKRKFILEQWTIKLPGSKRWPGKQQECNLYLRLLYAYLNAFVPKGGLGVVQPYRSSLLHYSSSYDCSAFVQAEFLVYALVHFWMVDNDFLPLPVNVCRSFGVSFPHRAVLGETPPTPGLGKVLRLLVQYLNCSLIAPAPPAAAAEGNIRAAFAESPVKVSDLGEFERMRTVMVAFESSSGSWNAIIQRPLYRFILRSFLFCPMGTSIKNASQVFSLWVTYLRPWKTSPQDFIEFEAPIIKTSDSSRKENGSSERKKSDDRKDGSNRERSLYTPIWESYVASNYLFYSSLVVHFLGFAHKFLHTNVETVVQMVLKVLDILTSSKELMDFLRKVDTACHLRQSGPFSSYVDNVHKYVPSIREQLQDWEDGLCESDADGSFLHDNWNHDLRLFSDGEDGAPKLLQLFVLRAGHEIRATSGDFQNLDSIRSKMSALFGGPNRESYVPSTPVKESLDVQHDRAEVFTPKHPGVGKRTWADVNYKGDWMRRPISDNEVAWLARLLIRLSVWLNEVVGLDQIDNTDSTGPTYVDVPHDETGSIGSPKEALIMVIALIGSWLSLFVQSMVRFMRGHGLRINLRVLASKKVVMVLVVYAVACVLKKALWTAAAMPSSL